MWLLVINKKAGKRKALPLVRHFSTLLQQTGQEFYIINEDSAKATDSVLQSHLRTGNYSKVIAFGGDGLVNLCIQHIVKTNIAFGVVPAGTGNDFSRTLGLHKKDVIDLFQIFSDNSTDTIDVGRVSSDLHSHFYVQVLSTGFDAEVNALANKFKWPKGRLKYTLAMLLTLNRFKPIEYELNIDNEIISRKAMLLSVANGYCYGGGMKISPNAVNSDGQLDVLIVNPVSKIKLLTLFPKIFTGAHIYHPKVSTMRGKEISISAQTDSYADGEFVSTLPITVSVLPKALNTWVVT